MSGLSIGNGLSTGNGLSVGSGFSRGGGLYFSGFSVAPTLNLNFTTMTALPSTITFSRPSNATYYDSTGKLTYAPNNLSTFSENFSGAAWQVSNFTRTTGQSDPLGASNGTLGTFTSNGGNGLSQSALSLTADKSYIVSIYAKYGTWRWFEFTTVISGLYTRSWVDMQNGVAGATVAHASFAVTNVGSGWYRISAKISGTSEFYWTPRDANGNAGAATTNNGATFLVFGFQAEAVTYQTTPGTYNATTSAVYYGARLDYNPVTLAARGLLIEEARTNLLSYSEQFNNSPTWQGLSVTFTANTVNSPSGVQDADTLTATAGGGRHFANQSMVPVATGQNYALSVYVKKGTHRYIDIGIFSGSNGIEAVFDLDGGGSTATQTNVGSLSGTIVSTSQTLQANGFYRLVIVGSATIILSYPLVGFAGAATGNTFNGGGGAEFTATGTETFYAWGAQLELGAFATSYIPTAASSVARSADTVNMTGTNFSSWYNQSEGSFVVNTTPLVATGTAYSNSVFGLLPTTGTGGGSFFLGQNVAQNWLWWRANGSMAVTFGTVVANTPAKLATAYKLADYAAVANNGTVGTSSDATALVNATSLSLGGQYANQPYGGYIASLVYYPQRLPNATLQSLTT